MSADPFGARFGGGLDELFTENIGADRVLTAAGGNPDCQALEAAPEPILRQHFRPEFLNRIDEIILFRGLDRDQLRKITPLMLEETRRRLAAQHVSVELTDAAVDLLARHGFQPEFGARPLRRTIQRELDNPLSAMLLRGELDPGTHLRVDADEGRLTFRTSRTSGEHRPPGGHPPTGGDAAHPARTTEHLQEPVP